MVFRSSIFLVSVFALSESWPGAGVVVEEEVSDCQIWKTSILLLDLEALEPHGRVHALHSSDALSEDFWMAFRSFYRRRQNGMILVEVVGDIELDSP